MQNVVCPMTMVTVPSWMPVKEKNEFSAIPVMMPGSASGSTSRNEMASRPKKANLCSAYAVAEPSSTASAVATRPTRSDSRNALRTWGSCQATENQCSEKPAIGQLSMFEELNAYSTISTIGMNRNASTRATQIRSPARSQRDSISSAPGLYSLERAERPRAEQVAGHDHDGEHGHGRGERDVVRHADIGVDDVADEVRAGPADQQRGDVITEGQREREDRAGHDARQGQREQHQAGGPPGPRAQVLRRLDLRGRDPLQRRVHRDDHERQPQVAEDDEHGPVRVDQVHVQDRVEHAALGEDQQPGVHLGQVTGP